MAKMTFNINDEDAVSKIKDPKFGGCVTIDDIGNVTYSYNEKENSEYLFEFDREVAEHLFYDLYILIDTKQNTEFLDILNKKMGLFETCRYAFEDAQSAIDSYKEITENDYDKNSYLLIYGLFQAMTIQHDSLKTLSKLLLKKEIDFKSDYPQIEEIRNIRNNTVGHPTDRLKGKKYFLISAPTLNKREFYLVEHNINDEKTGKQISVYPQLLITQERQMKIILNELMEEIIKL